MLNAMLSYLRQTSFGFDVSKLKPRHVQLNDDFSSNDDGGGEGEMKIENLFMLCQKMQNDYSMPGIVFRSKHSLHGTLIKLQETLQLAKSQISTIESFAPQYDPKIDDVKANGYRSFLSINYRVIDKLMSSLMILQSQHYLASFYDVSSIQKEAEYWIGYLYKLSKLNTFLLEMHRLASCGNYSLFPEILDLNSNPILKTLSEAIALEDTSIFFDKGAGLHVHEEVRKTINFLIFCEACASDLPYFSGHSWWKILGSLISSNVCLKYLYDFNYLGRRLLSNAREQQLTFCKRFYSTSELPIADFLMTLGTPFVSTNVVIHIPSSRISVQDSDNNIFEVPIPVSHVGPKCLDAGYISTFRTPGMVGACCCSLFYKCKCETTPSRSIIFHAHGGAFVSQTSKSHQTYLKYWASDTGIPILSIDYSLAPEAPYPRATEEVFYAYCWMRNNFHALGTTGENIIFAGDSAGANLLMGVVLQCIHNNLPGPNFLTLFYPAMVVQSFPSPSRLISLLDPLAMFPFLLRCMNSYTDANYLKSCPRSFEEELDNCVIPSKDPLLSPIFTSPETLAKFPNTFLFSSTIDICLDETIEFSHKLVNAGVPVSLHVFKDLPHGFLSLNGSSNECQKAVNVVSDTLKSLMI